MRHLQTFEQQLNLFNANDDDYTDDVDQYNDIELDEADDREVVSFDFDGVLHSSVVPHSLHPINFYNPRTWAPRQDIFEKIHEENRLRKVIVVTARNVDNSDELWEFIYHFNLPIEEVYCTNDEPKLPLLKKLKVIRHYDDNEHMGSDLRRAGIEFVLSKPPYMTAQEYFELSNDEYELW